MILVFCRTPEGRRLTNNALKILREDGFQPRNLYPVKSLINYEGEK